MNRHLRNDNDKFRNESLAHMQDMQGVLEQRQTAMTQEWDNLDRAWEDLKEKMSEVGMSVRSANIPDPILLNVGGSEVYVPRHVLEGLQESSAAWTLGDLLGGGVWDKDKRLPRDSHGQVFVDESPACFQHLIRDWSRRFGKKEEDADSAVEQLAADEVPYLPHVAGALGFSSGMLPLTRMTLTGGSTVLEAHEVDTLATTILGWCPGEPNRLELLYRASRDGWTARMLLSKSGNTTPTLTLVRVKPSDLGTSDAVVGGYSSVPWNGIVAASARDDPASFVFMLKDGGGCGPAAYKPVMWGARNGAAVPQMCFNQDSYGLAFGNGDLLVHLNYAHRHVQAGNRIYDIPTGSPFLALDGRTAVEFEVFQVCSSAKMPQPAVTPPLPSPQANNGGAGLIDCTTTFGMATTNTEAHEEDDLHWFGASVAGSLQRERVALRHAQTELVQANAQAAVSAQALAAVYGPDAAEGKEDPVIEFSVRGARATTRMATLLSTIQACPPESVLAVRSERWSENDNDKDAGGRWQINDCSPSVFAKVLDVMRMKKRSRWDDNGSLQDGSSSVGPVRVVVKSSDRSSFEEFVNMYFPGCESFILDSVDFRNESPAP